MILHALQILAAELNAHLDAIDEIDHPEDEVVIGNISVVDSNNYKPSQLVASAKNRIILTLVRVEEDTALKNKPAYSKNPLSNQVEYRNPSVHVNLYVLFTFNNEFYDEAIIYQSRLIRFFQRKNIFTQSNTSFSFKGNTHDQMDEFKIIVDLYSPSFEEANHIWSTNGGKQLPYVMYKIRLLELQLNELKESRPAIEEIQIDGSV